MRLTSKKVLAAVLAAVMALGTLPFVGNVKANAAGKNITVSDIDKSLLSFGGGDTYLIKNWAVESGVTLRVTKNQMLFLSAELTIKNGGKVIVDGGYFGVYGRQGSGGKLIIEKGGVLEYMPSDKSYGINATVNNGTIIINDGVIVQDGGQFTGNRPIGHFQTYTTDLRFLFDLAWTAYPGIYLGEDGDDGQTLEDMHKAFVGRRWYLSGYYGLPIYWSVVEGKGGFVYTAELIPEFEYDGAWILDPNNDWKEIDYFKPHNLGDGFLKGAAEMYQSAAKTKGETAGGTLSFGDGWTLKCAYNPVKERDPFIDKLIETQGAHPVVGRIKAEPLPTSEPAPTPAPTPKPTPDPNAPKIGTKMGDVLFTDIKAYINGSAIPSYNIAGSLYVWAADLRNYGFDVTYDNATRSTAIKLANGKGFTPLSVAENTGKVGAPAFAYLYTDIKTYINGKEVTSRNVNNATAIPFAELRAFGEVKFDDATRSSTLTVN